MQAGTLFRGAIVLMLAMAPSAHADPFLAKPGAWETTGSVKFEPDSERYLEHDYIQDYRQKTAGQGAADDRKLLASTFLPPVEKRCFNRKDMEQGALAAIDFHQDDCMLRILEKSATRIVSEKVCPGPNGYTMTVTTEASSPESMKIQAVTVFYPDHRTVRTEVQARWLGESCADVPNQAR